MSKPRELSESDRWGITIGDADRRAEAALNGEPYDYPEASEEEQEIAIEQYFLAIEKRMFSPHTESMPNIKAIEIRDKGTMIGALAIRMLGDNPIQTYYFRRAGYPADGSSITLMCLSDCKATNDPYEWGALGKGTRTLPNAHNFIIDNFDALNDGDVVDVEVILGESQTAKVSERIA